MSAVPAVQQPDGGWRQDAGSLQPCNCRFTKPEQHRNRLRCKPVCCLCHADGENHPLVATDAIFASDLVLLKPMDTVMPISLRMASIRTSASAGLQPCSFCVPVISSVSSIEWVAPAVSAPATDRDPASDGDIMVHAWPDHDARDSVSVPAMSALPNAHHIAARYSKRLPDAAFPLSTITGRSRIDGSSRFSTEAKGITINMRSTAQTARHGCGCPLAQAEHLSGGVSLLITPPVRRRGTSQDRIDGRSLFACCSFSAEQIEAKVDIPFRVMLTGAAGLFYR